MDLKTTRKVLRGLFIALMSLIILGVLNVGGASLLFAYLSFADMIGIVVIGSIFQRCPHCGSFLQDRGKFCPHCGKELDQ